MVAPGVAVFTLGLLTFGAAIVALLAVGYLNDRADSWGSGADGSEPAGSRTD
jgi:hypothetical protein